MAPWCCCLRLEDLPERVGTSYKSTSRPKGASKTQASTQSLYEMLKVQLSLLAVALMLVSTATESQYGLPLTNPNMPIRACGKRLTQHLQFICGGKYNPLYTKKSLQDGDGDASYWEDSPRVLGEDSILPLLMRESAAAMIQGSFRRQSRGVIDECCKKSCSVRTLSTYCAATE